MPDYQVSIGSAQLISLSDEAAEVPHGDVFPQVTRAQWDQYPGSLTAEGNLNVNFGCFAVRSEGQTILIDTGLGPGYPGKLLEELKSKGVPVDDVTHVAITHLHPDHIGWNITDDNGQPRLTFPNARYWLPKGDMDYYKKDIASNPHVSEQAVPLEDLGALELAEGETNLTGEVTMVPTPGHTPGHMSIAIQSQGEKGFVLGDVINFPAQAEETAWQIVYDTFHDQARETREAVLERLEKDGSLVGMGHAVSPSFGHFIRTEGKRYWKAL